MSRVGAGAPGNFSTSSSGGGTGTTGAAVPSTAMYVGGDNSSGNLQGISMGVADTVSKDNFIAVEASLYNGSTYDRPRSAKTGLNSTGIGIATAQVVGQFNDTTPTSITEAQFGNIRMSANRNMYMTIRDGQSGTEIGVTVKDGHSSQGNALLVEQPSAGTTLADGNTNSPSMFTDEAFNRIYNPNYPYVYNGSTWDRLRGGVTGDGQAITGFLQNVPMIFNGGTTYDRLRGGQGDGSGATGMLNISPMVYNGSTYDRFRSGGVTGMVGVSGDTASAASDAGNPVKIGGRAQNAEITAVTNGQRVNGAYDLVGKQIVMPYANKENFLSGTANTTGTSDTAVIAAQGAGLFIYITSIVVVNTGSSASLVTIETDTASAKTAIWQMIAPAGGGSIITFPTPIKGSVSNKNVGFVCGTGSTTVYCSIAGYAGT